MYMKDWEVRITALLAEFDSGKNEPIAQAGRGATYNRQIGNIDSTGKGASGRRISAVQFEQIKRHGKQKSSTSRQTDVKHPCACHPFVPAA
jgi:hypothetical protein